MALQLKKSWALEVEGGVGGRVVVVVVAAEGLFFKRRKEKVGATDLDKAKKKGGWGGWVQGQTHTFLG